MGNRAISAGAENISNEYLYGGGREETGSLYLLYTTLKHIILSNCRFKSFS